VGPGGGEGEDEAEAPAEEAEEGTLLSILYSNPLYGLFTGRRAGAGSAGGGGVARGGERGRGGDDGSAASGGGSAAVVIGNAQPAGLSNNSYYCFMNSGLQCLFATKGFLEATQRGPFHRHQRLLDELGALGTAVSRTHERKS